MFLQLLRPRSLTHPPRPACPHLPARSFRHLMLDIGQLLPHSKKDAKLDTKSERGVINEVADMKVGAVRGRVVREGGGEKGGEGWTPSACVG